MLDHVDGLRVKARGLTHKLVDAHGVDAHGLGDSCNDTSMTSLQRSSQGVFGGNADDPSYIPAGQAAMSELLAECYAEVEKINSLLPSGASS